MTPLPLAPASPPPSARVHRRAPPGFLPGRAAPIPAGAPQPMTPYWQKLLVVAFAAALAGALLQAFTR